MNKTNKIAALILVLTLLFPVMALSSCGEKEAETRNSESQTSADTGLTETSSAVSSEGGESEAAAESSDKAGDKAGEDSEDGKDGKDGEEGKDEEAKKGEDSEDGEEGEDKASKDKDSKDKDSEDEAKTEELLKQMKKMVWQMTSPEKLQGEWIDVRLILERPEYKEAFEKALTNKGKSMEQMEQQMNMVYGLVEDAPLIGSMVVKGLKISLYEDKLDTKKKKISEGEYEVKDRDNVKGALVAKEEKTPIRTIMAQQIREDFIMVFAMTAEEEPSFGMLTRSDIDPALFADVVSE